MFNMDLHDFAGERYVMHCTTEAQCKEFEEFLDSHGRKWRDGTRYAAGRIDVYRSCQEKSAYAFNRGQYGSLAFCESNSYYIILEFEDFCTDASPLDVDELFGEVSV